MIQLPSLLPATLAVLAPGVFAAPGSVTGAVPGGRSAALPASASVARAPQEGWAGLLTRDARAGFTPRTAEQAQAALAAAADGRQRAIALFGLGASGRASERLRLASWSVEGSTEERQGAVLGLGELARAGYAIEVTTLLEPLLDDPDAAVAECALLALLRSEDPRGAEAVREIIEGGGGLVLPATKLQVFHSDRSQSNPTRASMKWLELRWEAARLFGTIDGQAWSVAMRSTLAGDRQFMRSVILLAAAELSLAGVRDHLLEELLDPSDDVAIRACVRAMPREVDQLIATELWRPAGEQQWTVLVDEAVEQGVASLMPHVLEQAVQLSSIAPTAAGALARSDRRYAQVLPAGLRSADPAIRIRAAIGIADGAVDDYVRELYDLADDPHPGVRAAALVARVQLGDSRARDVALDLIDADVTDDDRRELIERLARTHRLPRVLSFMNEVLPTLEGREWALFAACLKSRGRLARADALRELFDELTPGSYERRIALRAIARFPDEQDRQFLAGLFPLEDDREANIELAIGLARSGHPDGLPLLQTAVWHGGWNESVLAAAVVKDTSGLRVLEHWIAKPPTDVAATDIRRLGFAIGEWGGMDALDSLTKSVGGGAERPALQGALLGALVSRTH